MAHILVVDDDVQFVESVRVYLESGGHSIIVATNREDGMRLANEKAVDLVILDVMMHEPDDGIAMAQELRRKGFSKPILMLSSISQVTGFTYGKDSEVLPVNDFLEKPVRPEVLMQKIAALLAK